MNRLSAQSPYRLVLIGLGRVAVKHLKAIRNNPDLFTLVALVDPRRERARALWREAAMPGPLPPLYPDLEACLTAERFDAAAIATPSGSHYRLASKLLERSVSCLIEKPITLDLPEAAELERLAREHNAPIALGYIYRFFPCMPFLRDDLAAGRYGRVLSASVEVYWGHGQAYYDAAAWRGSWKDDGGVLMNQCVHAVDLLFYLTNTRPVSAQAQIARQAHRIEAEDFGLVNYVLRPESINEAEPRTETNGKSLYLQLTGTTNSPEKRRRAAFYLLCEGAEIHCGIDKGRPYFSIRGRDGKNQASRYFCLEWKKLRERGIRRGLKDLLNPHSGIYHDWGLALRENRSPRASGAAGRQSLGAILAAYASAKEEGRVCPCPPDKFTLSDMRDFFD